MGAATPGALVIFGLEAGAGLDTGGLYQTTTSPNNISPITTIPPANNAKVRSRCAHRHKDFNIAILFFYAFICQVVAHALKSVCLN